MFTFDEARAIAGMAFGIEVVAREGAEDDADYNIWGNYPEGRFPIDDLVYFVAKESGVCRSAVYFDVADKLAAMTPVYSLTR